MSPRTVTISTTVADSIVITMDNPFEHGWETEFAMFEQNTPTARSAAALAATTLAIGIDAQIRVSGSEPFKDSMLEHLGKAARTLDYTTTVAA